MCNQHRIDGVELDAIDATPNEDAESNRQRREVDPPGDDVPQHGASVQDAVHEMVAHKGPGVAGDVGRDPGGAQVAHDAAEGKR